MLRSVAANKSRYYHLVGASSNIPAKFVVGYRFTTVVVPQTQIQLQGRTFTEKTETVSSNSSKKRETSSSSGRRKPVVTDEGVIIHESDPTISGDGLGLVWGSVIWSSGISLAKYFHFVERQQQLQPQKRRILELGTGTGIVGLTLGKLGNHVTLTDSESALWPILRQSIIDNGLDGNVDIHCLDWRDPSTFLMPPKYGWFDLVVAADVLYSGMDKLFARALAAHLPGPAAQEKQQQDGTTTRTQALIACPYRKDSPLIGFFQACTRLGLVLERLEDGSGSAVGCVAGVDPQVAFEGCEFVPLDSDKSQVMVTTNPNFTSFNQEKVQIFRVRRRTGSAKDAANIRRIARI